MNGKLICLIILVSIGFHFAVAQSLTHPTHTQKTIKIHADLIVLKLKTPSTSNGRTAFSQDELLARLKDIIQYEQHHQVFNQQSFSNARLSASNLQNIYKVKLKKGSNIWRELSKLKTLDFIEYAEPFFQNELLLIPNDPQADTNGGLQDYLSVIKAYDGWQIDQSDSSIVIGIVDTGVNMKHEDLGNVAYNYADPINGNDDDGDGYIDNFNGWDLSDADNDPTSDGHPHGTPVAGMSSATTNNGIGMAGIGFKSKYLPVKIAETVSRLLTNEYEGIIYAADHGCKVINLSWGGVDSYSRYGQDIINYAVLEKDVVVVAAAGNTRGELDFYPASFDNVLSVGATDINDNLASWATYSHFIDLMAPGNSVFSTKNNGSYEKTTGSSFSAPMVAGAAALVRSHFPEMSAIQVMEQLRITADDIYQVGSNMDFYGKLGRGRLNVHRALSDILTPSIRISDVKYTGNHGDLIFPGDTIWLALNLTNYLRNADNVSVAVSNASDKVMMQNGQFYIDHLETNDSFENSENPMMIIVNGEVKPGEPLVFRIDFIGNNYTDFQYFAINTTPEYFDISDGNISATISSDGDIGFDEPDFGNGNGISYFEELISSQTGLIISLDSIHVLDNVINNFETLTRDEDFVSETAAKLYDNSIPDFDARSVFKPQDTVLSALAIKVEQKILAWKNNTNDGYLIFEYRLINTGDSVLTGLNAGLFADWDLGDYLSNAAAWDTTDNFGYMFDKSSNDLYAGLALLSDQSKAYYAIDKTTLNGNQADINTQFGDTVKHNFLSSGSPKSQAGMQGAGNDVAQIVGGKNIILQPNQAVKITFAMLASTSLDGLKSALDLARTHYLDYANDPPLSETFYACQGERATIDPEGGIYEFYSDVGATQRIDSGFTYTTDPVFNDQTYYAINLDSAYKSEVIKFMVKSGEPEAAFVLPNDTLLIESGKSASIDIKNTSVLGDQWKWNFGNGYSSIVQNPSTSYQTSGLQKIELVASNIYGCSATTSQELFVGIRSEPVVVENQQICKGTKTAISASNTPNIKVYQNKTLNKVLFEGAEFLTDEITSDTVFYVSNNNGPFESVASPVYIKVKHPQMGFEYQLDTMNLDEKYVLKIYNSDGETDKLMWWVNGAMVSEAATINYNFSQEPIEISQIKKDAEGCADTLIKIISPAISSLPISEDIEVCKKSSVTIKPRNGEIFYFYDDADLEHPIHKGKAFVLTQVSEPKTFFVTGIDQLLESTPISIQVTIDPVVAIIETSAETIDLVTENQVEISNFSMNAASSYWLLPTGTIDTTSVIKAIYSQPGIYDYTLVAISQNGCTDTAFQSIQVVNITGLVDGYTQPWSIYPNPVSSILTIVLGEKSDHDLEFELFEASGKRLQFFTIGMEQERYELEMEHLIAGMYFIRSVNAAHPFAVRILKK